MIVSNSNSHNLFLIFLNWWISLPVTSEQGGKQEQSKYFFSNQFPSEAKQYIILETRLNILYSEKHFR